MINFFKPTTETKSEATKLYILSVGHYVKRVDEGSEDPLPELKTLVKESTGKAIRRITRFVQLALVGASRCCKDVDVDKHAGVYFASCRGDTGVTVDLLNGLVREQQPPAPLTFVNSVSNAACFQVAKSVDVFGSSNFITNRYDPIFAALQLAQSDFMAQSTQTALIGTVDCCALPLSEHRKRVGVANTQGLAEASNWLLLASAASQKEASQQKSVGNKKQNAVGTIDDIQYCSNRDKLINWLEAKSFPADTVLGVGQHLSKTDASMIMNKTNFQSRFDYIDPDGYYDSPTGEGVVRFINEHSAPMMLHVNSDPSGRFTVFVVSRLQ